MVNEYIDYLEYITNLRRHFHMNPELGNNEYKTQEKIIKSLESFDIPYNKIGTGVVGYLNLKKDKTYGIRADMDALPITESNDVSYKSKNSGVMHACGHDGHISILLTFIKWAANNKDKIKYNLVFIFQPAEEIIGGALKMIEGKALENVDEIYALHLCPEITGGIFGLKSGILMAGVIEFNIEFFGKSCHVADCKKGKDAVRACADFLNGFSPAFLKDIVFNCGKIAGGYARNIVADYCLAECTFRFFTKENKEEFLLYLNDFLKGISEKHGVDCKLDIITEYIPLVNDKECIEKVRRLVDNIDIEAKFSAEDFAFYLDKKKGCLVWLGIKDEMHKEPLHSVRFDFDEKYLLAGVDLFVKLCSAV